MIVFSLKRAGLGLQEGARTIADQSIGSYSTKAGAVFTACMTARIAEGAYTYEMNDK
jgi:hypothetical protein